MKLIMILLGILYIVIGFMFFVLTEASKEALKTLLKRKNLRLFSFVPIIFGIMLILGSSLVTAPWFVIILGMLGILKGLFFIFGPEKKMKPLIDWCLNASDNFYKVWGVAAFLLGVILLLML